MNAKIYISGASGFIGSNLVEKFCHLGVPIKCLSRSPQTTSRQLPVEWYQGDITDLSSFHDSLQGCDTVYHCAGYISFRQSDFASAYQVNVEGTRNILEAALRAGIKKFILLSAGAVLGYSQRPRLLDETSRPEIKRNNVYAYTKNKAEQIALEYIAKGIEVVIANIATVYGPHDHSLNSGAIIKAVLHGKMRLVPPGGTSYVSSEDLLSGLLLLQKNGKSGERYIFSCENLTYENLVKRILRVGGRRPKVVAIPRQFFALTLPALKIFEIAQNFIPGISRLFSPQLFREAFAYKYFDNRKAIAQLGWRPRFFLEDAVQQAISYYQKKQLL